VRPLNAHMWRTGLVSLLATLACATPDERVAAACPAPDINTRDWREVIVENAGVAIRLPPDGRAPFPTTPHPEAWSTDGSSVLATIGNDPEDVPAWVDFPIFPSVSWKSHRSQCVERVASTTARIQAYFERWKALVLGRYVAAGAYELVPGSWLRIGGVSSNLQRQQEVLAALRTVRFLPPVGSAERPRPPTCNASNSGGLDWREFQASSAPFKFRAPPGSRRQSDDDHEIWSVGPMRVDFKLLRTRDWFLQSPTEMGSTWCALNLDGRYTEVRVVPVELGGTPSDEFFYATAYVQLAPTSVLNIFAYITEDPDGPERFFALLRSLRVGPTSTDAPQN
jgi:hypothetical protein